MQQIRDILGGKRYQKRKIAKYYRDRFIERMEQKRRNKTDLHDTHSPYFS